MSVILRQVRESDAAALSEIYRPYVENNTATLEYDPPSAEEFADRIREISAEFPYIVCEYDGETVGYAYAHRYKARFGYRFCAELSVYIREDYRRLGLGKRMYRALIELLTRMGYTNLYGTVTDPNPGSFALHLEFGFYETGREHSAGVKFGEWHDVVIFEKLVGTHERLADFRERPLTIGELGGEYAALLSRA